MKSFSASRRRGRVVAQAEASDEDVLMQGDDRSVAASAVRRPAPKSKKGSSSKLSFGPGGASNGDSDAADAFKLKRSNLSRQAQERHAHNRSGLPPSLVPEHFQERHANEQPSYDPDDLAELKSSTPSLSSRRQSPSPGRSTDKGPDVAAKFGRDLSKYADHDGTSAIPTEAEIQEKKARRARLAREQKFKAHGSDSSGGDSDQDMPDAGRDSDDDEFMNQRDKISLANEPKAKGLETRLTLDDEDIMEDFDSFVDDGRIKLGREAEKEQRRKQREEMRDLIEDAEASTSGESDNSDRERRAEYEAAQTRKGMEGLRVEDGQAAQDPDLQASRKIAPVPKLSSYMEQLRAQLQGLEAASKETTARLEEVERKRQDIPAQEQYVQEQLKATGEQYERLRKEAGLNGTTATITPTAMDQVAFPMRTEIPNGLQ